MDERSGNGNVSRGAGNGVPEVRLPTHLLARINPDVLAARRAAVQARADDPHDRVLCRRVAEIVANSLLEDLKDAA